MPTLKLANTVYMSGSQSWISNDKKSIFFWRVALLHTYKHTHTHARTRFNYSWELHIKQNGANMGTVKAARCAQLCGDLNHHTELLTYLWWAGSSGGRPRHPSDFQFVYVQIIKDWRKVSNREAAALVKELTFLVCFSHTCQESQWQIYLWTDYSVFNDLSASRHLTANGLWIYTTFHQHPTQNQHPTQKAGNWKPR